MSELEKNLYKRVAVSETQKAASAGRVYRGFSTVDVNKEGYAKYDFDTIDAKVIDGLLFITLPYRAEIKPKKIKVI